MKNSIFTAFLLFASVFCFASHKPSLFIDEANTFFIQNVNEKGAVNYISIKNNPQVLNNLIDLLQDTHINSEKSDLAKAFYINAYNVLVIKNVVDNYPIKEPLDVAGFFDVKKYNVAGENLSLNELENKKIRAVFNDPRIHFALVCAAKGCPNLRNKAYSSSKVDAELEEQAKKTINDPTFVRIKPDSKLLVISEIFSWYKDDFTNEKGSIKNYINAYLDHNAPSSYKIVAYPYDWRLNEQ